MVYCMICNWLLGLERIWVCLHFYFQSCHIRNDRTTTNIIELFTKWFFFKISNGTVGSNASGSSNTSFESCDSMIPERSRQDSNYSLWYNTLKMPFQKEARPRILQFKLPVKTKKQDWKPSQPQDNEIIWHGR